MKIKTMNKTLLASGFALLACASMLIGTTYAWFTDSAQVTVSKIQVGKLDLMVVGEGDETTELTELNFTGEFAPGETLSLPPFYVKNNGSLQFKYKIIVSGLDDLNGVITWTLPNSPEEGEVLAAGAKSEAFTISGTMDSSVGNEVMGNAIDGIKITVIATQVNGEYVMPPAPSVVVTTPEKLEDAFDDPETKSVEVSEGTYSDTITVPADKELVVKDGSFNPPEFEVAIDAKENSNIVLDGGDYAVSDWMQIVDAQSQGANVTINEGKYVSTYDILRLAKDAQVTINGGTFESYRLCCTDDSSNTCTLIITGGTFTLEDSDLDGASGVKTIIVTGGTFNHNPTKYVNTDTHTVTPSQSADGTTWTVSAKQ